MIIVEYYMTRRDGEDLYRTYSDRGVMIECDGEMYVDAVDPVSCGRIYIETEVLIPEMDTDENNEEEVKQEDAQSEDGAG